MVERADDREEDQPKPVSLAQLTTDIVVAYVAHNQVASADLATLIGAVADRLRELRRPQEPEPAKLAPAVPVRRSLAPDHLVCLVCGKRQRMLKRHLAAGHGLTPDQYREAFPESQAGRHPRRHFRGLLRLHSRYGPLDRSTAPRRPLSQGFSPAGYPAAPLASYQTQPTTLWVEPSSTGDARRLGALRNAG